MATVHRRLREMSDEDLARQIWVIRASLATLSRSESWTTRLGSRPVRPETEAGGDGFLDAARAVGDHLESVALRGEQEVAWVGLVAQPDVGYWSLLPLGLDLYDGQPGVLLFLAYLGASRAKAGTRPWRSRRWRRSGGWSIAAGPRSRRSVMPADGVG